MMRKPGRADMGRGRGLRMPALLLFAALCLVAALEGLMIWTVERAQHGHADRLAQTWFQHMRRAMPELPRRLAERALADADADALRDAGVFGETFALKLFDPSGREVAALRSWNGVAVARIRHPSADAAATSARQMSAGPRRRGRGAGAPVPTSLTEADDPSLRHAHPDAWQALQSGGRFIELAESPPHGDRPPRYAEVFLPLSLPDGAVAGYAELYVDITGFSQEMTDALRIAGAGLALLAALGFGAPALGWWSMRCKTRRAQDEMARITQRDQLTDLPNRSGFASDSARLAQAAADAGDGLAVICLDIDGFRAINDLHGADAGDAVLRRIASCLRGVLRRDDVLARLGSDMFGVVVRLSPTTDLQPILARLSARAAAPIAAPGASDGRAISISMTIGACRIAPGEVGVDGGLRRAEIALQEARTGGHGRICVFQPEMETRMRRRRQVERSIREGIQRNRFTLHYQPLVRAADGRTRGFEALMRLVDANGKPISPGEFIPAAEDIGAISQLGAWALHEACAAAAHWPEALSVSVNLSVEQFRAGDLVEAVQAALDACGLPPDRLELEITESLLISNVDQVEAQLDALKSLGVSLAMDDFGTGYSSLSYLWRFRFDRLKLDRSFVQAFDQKPDRARTTIAAIVALGRRLDMKVTAEGVETEAQARMLTELGCDNLQGYHFGAPMPEMQLREVMRWEADAAVDLSAPRARPDAFGPGQRHADAPHGPPGIRSGQERRAGGAA